MHVTATELKNKLGQYLTASERGPVIVEKSGRPTSVVISFDAFKKLSEYEDYYWSKEAVKASKSGWMTASKTKKSILKHAKRKGVDVSEFDI